VLKLGVGTSAAKAFAEKERGFIAALKRCATQNQSFQQTVEPGHNLRNLRHE
jgi:hypothetical protein